MNITVLLLIIMDLLLIGSVVYFIFIRKKPDDRGLLSDLEGMDLLEFQQNLKSLIDELNVVANTNILGMDAKKKQVEDSVKAADARINELKYLLERSQLRRQAEYKEALSEAPEIPAEPAQETPQQPQEQVKEGLFTGKLVATGLEESGETPKDFKPGARDKYQHINSLLKSGLSIDEIAKVTGLTRGEIELIRNIKR